MSEILNEQKLTGEFTFGFELEALFKTDFPFDLFDTNTLEDEDFHTEWYKEELENNREIIEQTIADTFPNFNTDEVKIHRDGSIAEMETDKSDNYVKYIPFEWAMPKQQFSPKNIETVINGLSELLSTDAIITNETCAFHIHISFPEISENDIIWIMCQLAYDSNYLEKLMSFNDFKFTNDEFANTKYLDDLLNALTDMNFPEIKELLTTDKYRLFRIHPQGTLEWRGPRDFLNDTPNVNLIKDFFLLLYDFVKWISTATTKKEINGMTKQNFFQLLKPNMKEKLMGDFKSSVDEVAEKIINSGNNNSIRILFDKSKTNQSFIKLFSELTERFMRHQHIEWIEEIAFSNEEDFTHLFVVINQNQYYKPQLYDILFDMASTHKKLHLIFNFLIAENQPPILNYLLLQKIFSSRIYLKIFLMFLDEQNQLPNFETFKFLLQNSQYDNMRAIFSIVDIPHSYNTNEIVKPYIIRLFDSQNTEPLFKLNMITKANKRIFTNIIYGYLISRVKETNNENDSNVKRLLMNLDLDNFEKMLIDVRSILILL